MMDYVCSRNNTRILNVLIVDDDVKAGKYFKALLKLRGHNVDLVYDGLDCISISKETKYDILFIDYHMSDIDGAQVADIVRLNNRKVLIFAYTGDSCPTAINNFKKVGMNGVIIKPIDKECIDIIMRQVESNGLFTDSIINYILVKSMNSIIIFDNFIYN